jgi:cytochrome c-type biogenesis protein CcmH
LAAGGQVTAAAQDAFRKAVAGDPSDPRARYFLAVARDQGGDRKGAMRDWIALLNSAPPGAPWAAEVRAFVEKTARERGDDLSALRPAAAEAATPPPGPDAGQMAAAAALPPAQQQAMIGAMVDGLSARLKANPHDQAGWVRLMRSRMVLGQPAEAQAAYAAARSAFAGEEAQLEALRSAARDLGVPDA